ncbi:MAG TPA: DUF3300 domain-containing protein [Opitutaceae bacterium]|nr:DUF3300 domain-containing protein [Opitutaceae bacterium]
MKKIILVMLIAVCAPWLQAAMDGPIVSAPFTAGELDQLLRPIALYPDPLIALILPASTFPAEVVSAARFVTAGGDLAAIVSQPWDASVQALAHYPSIIMWMNANLEYIRTLGEAFAGQPEEVMQAIQRLRAQALANGTLTSTAQQVVVQEGDYISIEPTQPAVIYVPTYNCDTVYTMAPYEDVPLIQFGIGWTVGPWLAYVCDWGHGRIWVRARHTWWGHNWGMVYFHDWRKGHDLDRGGDHWRPDSHWLQARERAVAQARAHANFDHRGRQAAIVSPLPRPRLVGRPDSGHFNAPREYDNPGRAVQNSQPPRAHAPQTETRRSEPPRQAAMIPPTPAPRLDGHANAGHFNAPREYGNPGRAVQHSQPPQQTYAPRAEPPRSAPARMEPYRAAPSHSETVHSMPARSAPAESGGRGAGSRSDRDR